MQYKKKFVKNSYKTIKSLFAILLSRHFVGLRLDNKFALKHAKISQNTPNTRAGRTIMDRGVFHKFVFCPIYFSKSFVFKVCERNYICPPPLSFFRCH